MIGMSSGGDTRAVKVQLEDGFGFGTEVSFLVVSLLCRFFQPLQI